MDGFRDLSNWMSYVDGSKSLRDMTIPGTHDSGAYQTTSTTGIWAQTQNHDIEDQLKMGIRFLDIRLYRDESDELKVCHGPVNCNIYFRGASGTPTIMGWCKKFLSEHNSETIIMSIKEERDSSSFDRLIRAAIQEDKDVWLTGTDFPTLKNAKGKIVLIRRWNTLGESNNFGIDASPHIWNGGKLFEIAINKQYIQDDWDSSWKTTNTAITDKFQAVKDHINRAINDPNGGQFYWNFASINSGFITSFIPGFSGTPATLAKGIYGGDGVLQPLEALQKRHPYGPRLGTILLDFAGYRPDLLLVLVDRNMGPVWPVATKLNGEDKSPKAPFVCGFTDSIGSTYNYLFYKANDDSNYIYKTRSIDGKTWPVGSKLNGIDKTPNAVSGCVFTNKMGQKELYLFFRANDEYNGIYMTHSSDGTTWPQAVVPNTNNTTVETVGACTFNGGNGESIYIFWRAEDDTNTIYYSSSDDGRVWPDGKPINNKDNTPGSLCACVFKKQLFLFWMASDGSNLIYYTKSTDGRTFPPGKPLNNKDTTTVGMSACELDGRLYLFWKAADSSNLIYFSATEDGSSWPDGWVVNSVDATPNIPSSCVIDKQILLAWSANDSSNLLWKSLSSGRNPININES